MTERAAALKDWSSCSDGCGRGVDFGKEVLRDLIESMVGISWSKARRLACVEKEAKDVVTVWSDVAGRTAAVMLPQIGGTKEKPKYLKERSAVQSWKDSGKGLNRIPNSYSGRVSFTGRRGGYLASTRCCRRSSALFALTG